MTSPANLVPLRRLARSTLRAKMMAGLLLIVVPLIGFIIYSNVNAIEVVRHQVAESNKDLLTLYRDQLDGRLNEVDNYLFGLLSDTDLSDMTFMTSPDDRVFAAHRLQLEISKAVMRFPVIDGLYLYLPTDDRYLYAYRDRSTMNDRMNVKAHVTQEVSRKQTLEAQEFRKWYVERSGDQIYLVRAFPLNDAAIVGAWINANSFLTPLDLLGIGEAGAAVLGDAAGNAIANQRFVNENGVEIRPSASAFYLTGEDERFLAVGELSSEGEFGLYAFIPEDQILQNLPTLRIISFLLPFASVLMLLLGFLLLRKTLLVPINRLLQTMNRIRQGNLDMQVKQFPTSHEFQVVNDTFNQMMSEIKDLRISVYEEQLHKQRAELQHLQLQIKPHFFINTLNMMHTLARMKDLARMEELSLCLVRYFRYMFQSNLSYVSMKDELRHVRNYMRIQELRYPDQIAFRVEAPEFLLRTPVPSLVVHAFVENAVKHGVTLDEPVRIEVRLELVAARQPALFIEVQDTGPGFKPGVIEELEQDRRIVDEEGEHIGIWNVKQRLKLLYGEQAAVVLRNREPGGAVVRVTLPLVADAGNVEEARGGAKDD